MFDGEFMVPDPDLIRREIDATDERARLLRRLLRVAIRLKALRCVGSPTGGRNPPRPVVPVSEAMESGHE